MSVDNLKIVYGVFLVIALSNSAFMRMVVDASSRSPDLQNQSTSQFQSNAQSAFESSIPATQPQEPLRERQLKQTKHQKQEHAPPARMLNLNKLKLKSKKAQKNLRKTKQLLKRHNQNPERISERKLLQILKTNKKKDRKLWWWWWHRRRQQQREAERRRRQHQRNIRSTLGAKEKDLLIKMQKSKLRQIDRNKFDKLMQKERKKDAELWTRTFLYDAILLTEKLVYLEHQKMYKSQMKVALADETKEVSKLDKYYSKIYGKKRSELTLGEITQDIFM